MNKWLKAILITLGGAILILSAMFGLTVYRLNQGTVDFKPTSFDSQHWMFSKPEMSWESVRLKMVDDLVENHLKVGLQKSQIISLIGSPDETKYFNNYDMVYYLGRERNSIGIDSEWLVIKLQENKVESFKIAHD